MQATSARGTVSVAPPPPVARTRSAAVSDAITPASVRPPLRFHDVVDETRLHDGTGVENVLHEVIDVARPQRRQVGADGVAGRRRAAWQVAQRSEERRRRVFPRGPGPIRTAPARSARSSPPRVRPVRPARGRRRSGSRRGRWQSARDSSLGCTRRSLTAVSSAVAHSSRAQQQRRHVRARAGDVCCRGREKAGRHGPPAAAAAPQRRRRGRALQRRPSRGRRAGPTRPAKHRRGRAREGRRRAQTCGAPPRPPRGARLGQRAPPGAARRAPRHSARRIPRATVACSQRVAHRRQRAEKWAGPATVGGGSTARSRRPAGPRRPTPPPWPRAAPPTRPARPRRAAWR